MLAINGYVKLKPDTSAGGRPKLQVVRLSTIVRREYIVPDFATWSEGQEPVYYYVSKSKWDRLPKDDSVVVNQLG